MSDQDAAALRLALERSEGLKKELEKTRMQMSLAKASLDSVLFAMEDGLIATDPDGRVTLLNRNAQLIIFAAGGSDPIGRPLDEVFSDPRLSEKLEEISQHGHAVSLEMELWIPEMHIFAAVLTPTRDFDGNVIGLVVTLRDITTLRELERMKGAFLNTVSHELRTPMTSIRAFSELMATKNPSPDKVKNWSGIIYQEAERLGRLIDDLLDVSRLEAGKKLSIQMADFDMKELVEHSCNLFSNHQQNHPIEFHLDPGLGGMVGDVDRLHQVITNLLSNAIKYSPEGGTVSLRVRLRPQDQVRIEVEDKGMGLSEKDRMYVFEKFYRVENKEGVEIGGTGLGLSICRYVVEAHGGQIGVDSQLGQGSVFWFEIPRVSVKQEVSS